MLKLLIFLVLLFTCWPLSLAAVVLYPLIWLVLLPFRLVGLVVGSVFLLIEAIFLLPIRILRPRRTYPARLGYSPRYY